jgi:hypothetical protein
LRTISWQAAKHLVKKAKGEKKSGRKPMPLLARISLFLLAYLLSIGPAFWIRDHTPNPYLRESFECVATAVYWPVSTFAKSFRPFEYALNGYISLWT